MTYQQFQPSRFNVLPLVVKNLLIINGLFFLASQVLESRFGLDLTNLLGLHYFTSDKFEPYQIVSYMFMHGSLSHIFFNMFALWMFGNVLENVWGPKRFLIYYMITALGAAAIQMLYAAFEFHSIQNTLDAYITAPSAENFRGIVSDYFQPYLQTPQIQSFISEWILHPNNFDFNNQSIQYLNELIKVKKDIPTVGASGAVFGLLVAFGMLFPNTLLYIYFAIPIKAKYFVILYAGIELFSGIANNPGDNVAHFAHLGGAFFGFILVKFWNKKTKQFY